MVSTDANGPLFLRNHPKTVTKNLDPMANGIMEFVERPFWKTISHFRYRPARQSKRAVSGIALKAPFSVMTVTLEQTAGPGLMDLDRKVMEKSTTDRGPSVTNWREPVDKGLKNSAHRKKAIEVSEDFGYMCSGRPGNSKATKHWFDLQKWPSLSINPHTIPGIVHEEWEKLISEIFSKTGTLSLPVESEPVQWFSSQKRIELSFSEWNTEDLTSYPADTLILSPGWMCRLPRDRYCNRHSILPQWVLAGRGERNWQGKPSSHPACAFSFHTNAPRFENTSSHVPAFRGHHLISIQVTKIPWST